MSQAATVTTSIDVGSVLRDSAVAEILRELDAELIGLEPVKRRIREIAALLLVERMRQSAGLSTEAPSLHMCKCYVCSWIIRDWS